MAEQSVENNSSVAWKMVTAKGKATFEVPVAALKKHVLDANTQSPTLAETLDIAYQRPGLYNKSHLKLEVATYMKMSSGYNTLYFMLTR